MRDIKGFIIILLVFYISKIIESLIPITIPATVIGIVFLTILLITGFVKLEDVERPSIFMRWALVFLLVPVFVGAFFNIGLLKNDAIKILLLFLISTIFSIVSVAYITDKFARGETDE